ncbi:S-adenosylmethionine decarboxylase family protein [Neorhodopirellula pilleata]|uniref:S-adenosylmethionine decarboxylase proenzyme n=1 Tax=Neorhodopirellula pilleata TaxID=2714738 RepID=A0A5C6A623_9BACT|nr:S-adenosylmethionine decarboxylase [Neorhodopirellula pilleata]TWT94886.1 S-adenosylmethionine decarboxylase proenzyme precursor [Neorhodopirellula pilleata]
MLPPELSSVDSIVLPGTPILSVGSQWVIDAGGCDPERLRSISRIKSICDDVIESLGLQVIGQPATHQFDAPYGVTVLYLLSESHLACHTYPEHSLATFNFVCCRDEADWPWREQLSQRLGATFVSIRVLRRGVWTDAATGGAL